MKKLLLILLLFVSSVQGQITINGHTYADTIHITQSMIPYTATTNDRAYVLQEDITYDIGLGAAFTFNNCDTCALTSEPGQYYTLTLTRDSVTNGNGITVQAAGNKNDMFYMRKVRVVAGWDSTAFFNEVGENPTLLFVRGFDGLYIDSCYFYITGHDSLQVTDQLGIRAMSLYRNLVASQTLDTMANIVACSIIVDGYGFTNREWDPQTAIEIVMDNNVNNTGNSRLSTGSRSDYNLRIAHNYIRTNCLGIRAKSQGSYNGVIVVDSNIFDIWYKNTSPVDYDYRFGDLGAGKFPGVEKYFIRGNTIRTKVDSTTTPTIQGGAGFFLSAMDIDANGLPYQPLPEIAYNTIYAAIDTNAETHTYGIFSKWNSDSLRIIGNEFHSTGFEGFLAQNHSTEGLWLSNMIGAYLDSNTITVVGHNDTYENYGIMIRDQDSATAVSYTATAMPIHNMTINSNDWHVYFFPNETGISGVHFYDTYFGEVDTATTQMTGEGIYVGNAGASPDAGIVDFTDTRTDGNVAETLVTWHPSATGDIDFYRNIEMLAIDSTGDSLNAQVVVLNSAGDTVYNSNVGTDGLDSLKALYFIADNAGNTSYNPFSGFAVYPGEDTVFQNSFSVGSSDSSVVFTFGEVSIATTIKTHLKKAHIKKGKI